MPPSLVGLRAALKPSSSPPDVAELRGLYSGLPDRELRQLSLEEMFSLGEATANRAGLTDATFITLGQRYEKLTGWMPGRVVFELLQARKYIQTHVVITNDILPNLGPWPVLGGDAGITQYLQTYQHRIQHAEQTTGARLPRAVPEFERGILATFRKLASKLNGSLLLSALYRSLRHKNKWLLIFPKVSSQALPDTLDGRSFCETKLTGSPQVTPADENAAECTLHMAASRDSTVTPGAGSNCLLHVDPYYMREDRQTMTAKSQPRFDAKSKGFSSRPITNPFYIAFGHELIHVLHISHGLATASVRDEPPLSHESFDDLEEERTIMGTGYYRVLARFDREFFFGLHENMLRMDWVDEDPQMQMRLGHGGSEIRPWE
ncbi:hypothetical protein [Cystobacter fuscus]|uniref:hypothetical protein n=1 Tax=Cystobacter fuscus TaxID=43 RepID=UPI0005B7D95B|nr:hypothetical protein [Cystobacter fuscus]